MPSLGADMNEGRVASWLKQPGDRVARGELIADIETDKGVIAVECFVEGVLEEILVEVGAAAPVGAPLARIREDSHAVEDGRASKDAEAVEARAAPAARPGRVRSSPAARKLAKQVGLDLAALTGTGPEGAVTRGDVEAAMAARGAKAEPASEGPAREGPERMRAAIAAAMSRSKREIPHYYLSTSIDMDPALSWLSAKNEERSIQERVLPAALLVKAVAGALKEVPELNGFWIDGKAAPSAGIHIDFAVHLRGGGLVAPAIHDADKKSLAELMAALSDLIKRARKGALRGSEMSDASITITSMGERGVESVYGVINPPQVALVGFGQILERPWVVEGAVVPRQVVQAALSADHRASDGRRGALFLRAIARILSEPERSFSK